MYSVRGEETSRGRRATGNILAPPFESLNTARRYEHGREGPSSPDPTRDDFLDFCGEWCEGGGKYLWIHGLPPLSSVDSP